MRYKIFYPYYGILLFIIGIYLILYFGDSEKNTNESLHKLNKEKSNSRVVDVLKGSIHNNYAFVQNNKLIDRKPSPTTPGSVDIRNQKGKIILWYVKARYINPILTPRPLKNCQYKCEFTTNRIYHNTSSALLFSAIILEGTVPKRYPDQVFILHNHEPQCAFSRNSKIFSSEWKNQFNWTMWYRDDSDIHEPYGLIIKRDTVPNRNYSQIFHKKTKMVAAMISTCDKQSKRMPYIKKLMEYGVQVDIFGSCGNVQCPRGKDEQCRNDIQRDYKFFLAFESSFCPDYVTEKFYVPYQGDIITIARGGVNYSKIAPDDTFINGQHFKSAKALAEYIKTLGQNEKEYTEILKRKNKYQSLYEPYPIINQDGKATYYTYHYEEKPMCKLCQRLWNLDDHRKVYPDITTWFDKRKCFPPKDI